MLQTTMAAMKTEVPSGLSAKIVGSSIDSIDNLRRTGTGKELFRPTRKAGPKAAFYSFQDVVRLAVAWRCREFIGASLREKLWNAVPEKRIAEAFELPEGETLYMLVAATQDRKEPVQVRFQRHQPDMSIVVEDPEVVFNFTYLVKSLWRLVENAASIGMVQKFDPQAPPSRSRPRPGPAVAPTCRSGTGSRTPRRSSPGSSNARGSGGSASCPRSPPNR